jgi:hypothetical protein
MDALLAVLREHAASPEEDPNVDPGWDWQWDVNSDAIRMRAYTKEVLPDPEKAWQAAVTLRDSWLSAMSCVMSVKLGPCRREDHVTTVHSASGAVMSAWSLQRSRPACLTA